MDNLCPLFKEIKRVIKLTLIALFMLPAVTFAQSSCLYRLDIIKNGGDGGIPPEFHLNAIEQRRVGDESSAPEARGSKESSGPILEVCDGNGDVLESYPLRFPRGLIAETETSGKYEPLTERSAIITIPIPEVTKGLKVRLGEQRYPLPFEANILRCESSCVDHADSPTTPELQTCCPGLNPMVQRDGQIICTKCGDQICSPYENDEQCKFDCEKWS